MAGDWIKWSKGLASRREVVILAAALGRDRHEIAGRLMVLWEWCDENIPDTDIDSVSLDASLFIGDNPCAFVDALVSLPGFADALASSEVRWLSARSGGRLTFPNFGRHNGTTAKTRGLEARKKQRQRKAASEKDGELSRCDRDINGTRDRDKRLEIVVKRASTSDVDADARIEMLVEDRGEVVAACNRVLDVVPLGKEKQRKQDRSLVFKAVLLSRTVLSEDWLLDSLEAVKTHRHEIKTTPMRYWWGVLKSKCESLYPDLNFKRLLKRVVVPPDILNGGAKP